MMALSGMTSAREGGTRESTHIDDRSVLGLENTVGSEDSGGGQRRVLAQVNASLGCSDTHTACREEGN